jgi:hypothetical protein
MSATLGGNTALQIWAVPLVLGVLTMFGLLAALLGSGIWHWLAWLTLLTPIAVGGWFALVAGKNKSNTAAAR